MNYEEIQKENLRKEIIEMVKQIKNEKYLKMIYGYVNSAYREEKSRV